ncbi:cell differentiation family, Rcd1-like protein, partial [Reticulomyxa filosa]
IYIYIYIYVIYLFKTEPDDKTRNSGQSPSTSEKNGTNQNHSHDTATENNKRTTGPPPPPPPPPPSSSSSSSSSPLSAQRRLENFKARFDFLGFLLQNSRLQLKRKQLDDLWKIVIGDKLDESNEHHISSIGKTEHDYFFHWLKEICPSNNKSNISAMSQAMTLDDAVHLFQTQLLSMPRKTMTSESLECLHRYFELVHSMPVANTQSTGQLFQSSVLSSAIDMMWEIAIEAEEDRVAESCGVFVTTFYMKPTPSVGNNSANSAFNMFNGALISGLTRLFQNAGNTTTNKGGTSNDINNNNNNNNNNTNNNTNNSNNNNNNNNSNNNNNNNVQPPVNKWQSRHDFVEKCMGYMQQHGLNDSPLAYLHRCLNLLETFVECTRPGTMSGDNSAASGLNDMCSDPSSGINLDINATSRWDLGRYRMTGWSLPIGRNVFTHINLSVNMNKTRKNFKLIISNRATVDELLELVAGTIKIPK